MEKQYFIQVGWDVAYKNKLDELLHVRFRELNNTIIQESKLDLLKKIHSDTQDEYFQGKGKCRRFEYGDNRKNFSFKPNDDIIVYVSDTFRLSLKHIKEAKL